MQASTILTMLLIVSIVITLLSTHGYCNVANNGHALLDKCVSSRNHKWKPGPEGKALKGLHCDPWSSHSCCTWNTSAQIHDDGVLSLYNMVWDQCPENSNMSEGCRKFFKQDTCFYECSPYLGPWIIVDKTKRKTRKTRMYNVPLCHTDCEAWYQACLFDYTCNDNWAHNWNWKRKGTPAMCTKPCKTFHEYFPDPKVFCEKIFDNSFKYETDEKKCMNLRPVGLKNKRVALARAEEISSGSAQHHSKTVVALTVFLAMYVGLN